jgi:HK97 family phage prohead protease
MEATKKTVYVIDDIKDVNTQERSITHFITTEHEDRYGDVVRSAGMDDKAYGSNPVVLFGHQYRSFPVGKSLWRKATERNGVQGVLAKTQFADTPEGLQTFKLWEGGYLNAASIGFIPKKWEPIVKKDEKGNESFAGYDIQEWELLEYSITPVPANGQALRNAINERIVTDERMLLSFEDVLRESRLCELESCKADMESLPLLVKELRDQNAYLTELANEHDARIKELAAKKVENVAMTLSGEQLKALVDETARGAFNRMRGKL